MSVVDLGLKNNTNRKQTSLALGGIGLFTTLTTLASAFIVDSDNRKKLLWFAGGQLAVSVGLLIKSKKKKYQIGKSNWILE